ncbi:MAG: hypothetical protein ACRDRT_09425 [Pseudonocardiaceae bacterium]
MRQYNSDHERTEARLGMVDISDRDRARDRILELADRDIRVVAGAMVGSLALTDGDRFSELDLTFGVVGDRPPVEVLDAWEVVLRSAVWRGRSVRSRLGTQPLPGFSAPGCPASRPVGYACVVIRTSPRDLPAAFRRGGTDRAPLSPARRRDRRVRRAPCCARAGVH